MSFKGKFELVSSKRAAGVKLQSFVLTCTNWFSSETVDCMLSDEAGLTPYFFRNQVFKAGRSYRFDYDTVNWTWYQHDYFAILNKNGRIVQKWQLNLTEYGPGECPECHGTEKCKHCNGEGYIYPKGRVELFKKCEACGGTGMCQKCYVPRRKGGFSAPTGIGNGFK